ncbi:MAG: hypothetical protein CR967_05620 [Proteobacteria bacterium]|nr:MAG: hypothetical protein CR967_05620 [Pseudomonadota bacterium]
MSNLAKIIVPALLLCGCGGGFESEKKEINLTKEEKAILFSQQLNRVDNLLDKIRDGKDMVVSETGISKILDAIAKGAAKESQAEIRNFIFDKQLPLYDDETYKNFNLMFFRDQEVIYESYINSLDDFVMESSVKDMNDKIDKLTDGMIKNAMENISPNAEIVLSNIMTFNGKWQNSFDEDLTEDRNFTALCDGKPKIGKVATMNGKLDAKVLQEGDIEAVLLPFVDGYNMIIAFNQNKNISPKSASKWMYSNGGENIQKLIETKEKKVQISLPKLDISLEYNLIPFMKQLGISSIFSGVKADLSGISSLPLFVDLFEQKLKLKVHEKGAKAAAVTTAQIRVFAPMPTKPIIINIDHPFAFAILKDKDVKQIILSGEINSLGLCGD